MYYLLLFILVLSLFHQKKRVLSKFALLANFPSCTFFPLSLSSLSICNLYVSNVAVNQYQNYCIFLRRSRGKILF